MPTPPPGTPAAGPSPSVLSAVDQLDAGALLLLGQSSKSLNATHICDLLDQAARAAIAQDQGARLPCVLDAILALGDAHARRKAIKLAKSTEAWTGQLIKLNDASCARWATRQDITLNSRRLVYQVIDRERIGRATLDIMEPSGWSTTPAYQDIIPGHRIGQAALTGSDAKTLEALHRRENLPASTLATGVIRFAWRVGSQESPLAITELTPRLDALAWVNQTVGMELLDQSSRLVISHHEDIKYILGAILARIEQSPAALLQQELKEHTDRSSAPGSSRVRF